jgi:uncharacterized protein (TIGR03437 family)
LFSANADGEGIAAAIAVRVLAGGAQTYEDIARFEAASGRFVSVPLDLGPASDQVVIVLFGTGFRLRDPSGTVTATVGGEAAEVLFAGSQPEFEGLDQINILLPRVLSGRGIVDVQVTVDGVACNLVQVDVR